MKSPSESVTINRLKQESHKIRGQGIVSVSKNTPKSQETLQNYVKIFM